MGARTLEASLRSRLFVVIGPLLLLVSGAFNLAAARALDAGAREAVQRRATAVLRGYETERAEGDSAAAAASQVVAAADAEGLYIRIAAAGLPKPMLGRLGALPKEAEQLRTHACQQLDLAGRTWLACAEEEEAVSAVVALPVESSLSALRTLLLTSVAIVVAGLLLAALAVRAAVKTPLRALRGFVEWTESVLAAERQLPAPRATTDELTRLGAAFDSLLARLFSSLERARASGAHIAHELRTPLTAVRAELEAMPTSTDGAVQRALADVERLSNVIDAILVLSGPPGCSSKGAVVNVADVVRALCGEETLVVGPDEALVHGDEHLIELAIQNLLDNALRYSGHAARAVRVSRAGERVQVSVIDDGPGVPESSLAKMFDRYWRADSTGVGSGLGLALVKAVAERHGGSATARALSEGGLEVSLTLGSLLGWHDDIAAIAAPGETK